MDQLSEMKCPACGNWSGWTSKIDAQCPHCQAYFTPRRMQYEEEKRLKTEQLRKNSYLIVKEDDDPLVSMAKETINWLRWATFYGISVMYFFIAIIVVLYGLVML
jgi:hypothetical protein